jgi:Fur family iron response transcriptional regulator
MNMSIATTGRGRSTALPRDIRILLNSLGLRSTPRRIALTSLLLAATKRRVTAEILYKETREARCSVSRATVSNALRQFEQAGLLRRITFLRSEKAWFVIANANAPHLFELNSGR